MVHQIDRQTLQRRYSGTPDRQTLQRRYSGTPNRQTDTSEEALIDVTPLRYDRGGVIVIILLHFTGPPVPITARMHLTPQRGGRHSPLHLHDVLRLRRAGHFVGVAEHHSADAVPSVHLQQHCACKRTVAQIPRPPDILSPLLRLAPATGMFSLPFRDWFPLRVRSLSPSAIGARYGYVLSPLPRWVPTTGMFSLPFRNWRPLRVCSLFPSAIGARYGYVLSLPFCDGCPLRVCSLSPSAIDARYGYVLSPLPRLVPVTGMFSLPFRDGCPLR
eukprot:1193882-Prorocentrum_minimum.AAC.1